MSQALMAKTGAEPGYVSYASNGAMMFRSSVLHKSPSDIQGRVPAPAGEYHVSVRQTGAITT